MNLIVLSILLNVIITTAPCQGLEENTEGLVCPDASETSLVSAVISGCKVHYTCVNGVVSKLYHCSESQLLEGTANVCQENPQCPGLQTVTESENLQANFETSADSEPDLVLVATLTDINRNSTTLAGTVMHFMRCMLQVQTYDEYCNTCINANLVYMRPFNEIDLSTQAFDVYSKMLNRTKTYEDQKYDTTLYKSFSRMLREIRKFVCEDLSKPGNGSRIPETRSDISLEDPDLFAESLSDPDTNLAGDRVRRSTLSTLGFLAEMLWDALIQVNASRIQTDELSTSTTPAVTTDSISGLKDNRTLMSEVIVPIIQNIVNDVEALNNVTSLVRAVFEAVVPLATEILKASNDSSNTDQESILKIPRQLIQNTVDKIYTDACPILESILISKFHYSMVLLSKNVWLMFRSWDEVEARLEPNMQTLLSKATELYRKYFRMYLSSTKEFIHTYSLVEIQQDIESVYSLLPEQSTNLLKKNWSVIEEASDISAISISKMLLDIPGIFEAMGEIPFDSYIQFFFNFF